MKLLKSAITRYNVSDTEAVDLLLPKVWAEVAVRRDVLASGCGVGCLFSSRPNVITITRLP